MTSKRDLENELELERRSVKALEEECQAGSEKNRRLIVALERIAKHYGFYDAYRGETIISVRDGHGGWRELPRGFDAGALLADLDTIDQERSADEARKRLGITKEEA